ncbi:alpha/beta hydrolase [Nakamurella antarctica]|uniref:Alpha/beta hydrolase n=1 Tax=Nakamurella antarctica TaxID=1902245 RepID=A0A3G8ZLJ6_9ACTN|nr:alpha/beta hydrolase [Nakamurella antarctica]
MLIAASALPPSITSRYALVGMDLRGSGNSVEVNCFDARAEVDVLRTLTSLPRDPTTAPGATTLEAASRNFTFACQDYIGPQIVHFNTVRVADDLDSLRSALKAPTLNLFGAGYGATVGAVYVDRYPGRAGKVVLDAPEDHLATSTALALTSAQAFEASLDAFAADCAAKPDCSLGKDARAEIVALLADLGDPRAKLDSSVVYAGTVLLTLTLALPDRGRWSALASALAAAEVQNYTVVAGLLSELIGKGGKDLSLQLIIGCNDTAERLTGADFTAAVEASKTTAPLFGPFTLELAALCQSWPAADQALAGMRGRGAAPVVVIGGAGDPVAPYPGVKSLASQLSSAVLLSWQGDEHGSYTRSKCIAAAVDSYFESGQIPNGGTLCPA